MQLLHRLVRARDVAELIFGASGAIRLARDLPNDITFEPPGCMRRIRKIQRPMNSRNGSA